MLNEVKEHLLASKYEREAFVDGMLKPKHTKPNPSAIWKFFREDPLFSKNPIPLIFAYADCANEAQEKKAEGMLSACQ